MTEQEVANVHCHGTDVIEMMMLFTTIQFFALEEVARWQNLTVGQLIRRSIGDFLRQIGQKQ
jgi:hypothetical protein